MFPLALLGRKKKRHSNKQALAKGCIVFPAVPERCPAQGCFVHHARGSQRGLELWMGVGRLLAILWEGASACTLLPEPDSLWWAQSAFSPAPVKFLPPPLFPTQCLCGDVSHPGEREPPSLSSASHLYLALSGLLGLSCFPQWHLLALSPGFWKAPLRWCMCIK